MIERVLALSGLLVCLALLLRMLLPREGQARWDRFWRRRLDGLRGAGRWLQRQWRLQRSSRGARDAAQQTIDRARRQPPRADREGNVIRPRQFRQDDGDQPPLH